MKYKKSMIILIITIFLFSIASACASDANTTATAMVDEQTTEEVNEMEVNNPASDYSQILGSSASNEILKEGSITITNHTFEAIESAIDEGYGTIYLEPGTYNGTDTIGIMDMENVRIIGNSTILDGQGMTEIFFIINSENIMMQDITFINGNFDDGGAVIATYSSNVQIIDCTFINNNASLMGGAIMLTFVDAEVINSTFTNNKAIADGGAIGWIGGNVKIEGCIFTNNTSEGSSIVGGQAATANISTSIFTDNSAAAIVYGCAGNYMTVNNNIFINNNGTAIDFEDPDSNVDYNWFGHNQSNYKDEPGIKSCSKWLFLNATVNPTEISINQNSIIAFKLDSYDNSSGDVDPFDASKLNLILDLTQTLGELDKTTALIGENITYTAKQGGNARITGKYETASYTIELNNVKLPTEINIANSTIALKANGEADAGATLNPDGAGNLTYTSNNSKVAIVKNGKIKALSNGTATITVSFEGNDQYDAAANKIIDVTVSLNDASVSVNNSTLDLFVGDTFTIVATTVPDDLNVTYVPDNAGVVSVDENGVVTALKNGTATIVVKVGDGKVYAENSTIVSVTVNKIPTEIIVEQGTADLNVGDEFNPVVSLMPSNVGNLSFQSDDADVALVNGYGIITAVGEGEATITVSFSGNKKYAAAESKNITVTVSKVPTEISAEGCELFVDDNATISYVLIPEDAEGDVRFMSNDSSVVYADAETGVVVGRGEGTATVTVTYFGNDKYESSSTNVTVTVRKIPTVITAEGCELFVDDNVTISYVLIPEDAEGDVRFMSNDSSVVYADAEAGVVVGRGVGTATVSVTYFGNDKYESSTTNVTVTVSKVPTEISAEDCELFVDDNVTISYVLIPEDAEGDVRFMSNDSSVVYADAETGVVVGRGVGTATVSVTYFGNDKYESSSTNVTVIVNKIPTKITAEGCELFVDDNVTISYVLIPEDAEGDVRFMSNDTGIVYADAETGVVVARGAGTATVSVTYFGNDKYESSTTNVTVTVSKIPTEIAAEGCELFVDDNVAISYVLIPEDAEGDVRFMSNDSSVVYADAETGIIVGRAVGTATVSISFFGDDRYESSSTNVTVTVSLKDASVVADPDSLELFVGETGKFYTTTTPEDLDIEVSSSNESVATVELVNRVPTVTAVGEGSAVITVTINENVYVKNSTTVDVTVRKIPTEITAEGCELYVDDNATISYKLIPEDAEGDVRFMSNDSSVVYADAETGIIVGRGEGTATVSVTYFGDDKYASSSTNVTVTVNKIPTEISAEGCELYVDDNATISYKLIPEDAEGDVRFMSNDSSVVYADAETGVVVGRGEGTATVSVTYFGNDKYASSTAKVTVTVSKVPTEISAEGCELYGDGNATISYELIPEDAEGDVRFMSNDTGIVYADAETGVVVARGAGTATVSVSYFGNDKYAPSNTTVKVVVNKLNTTLVTKYENGTIYATVTDANGNPVSGLKVGFAVNGVKYVISDENGQANYTIGDLEPGYYSVKVMAYGNDLYETSNQETVVVTKEQSKIYLRNALYFVTQTKMVKVTLWDGKNKPIAGKTVHIKVYDSLYSGVTDKDGNAYIRVGIGFGVHNATVSFDGDYQYAASNRTGQIKVIKETPSIMVRGADQKFNVSDNPKTVKVYLWDRNSKPLPVGSKVAIKINGQTYVGLTDSNGIASININVNTVGVYDAELKYAGNSAYNAVTRKIQITIS